MNTINPTTAHNSLTRQHKTMRWMSDIASVSVRKTNGRFTVRVENFETKQIFKNDYATLAGALINAETMREFYL